MGKYVLGIILMFVLAITAFAELKGVPFNVEEDARFNAIETLGDTDGIALASGNIIVGDASGNANSVTMSGDATMSNAGALTIAAGAVEESMLAVPTTDGKNAARVVRANLDCGVSDCSAGTVSMVQTLPAKALIKQAWWYTETQFVDAGAGTVAIHCEDADNIFTAADITGNAAGSIVAANSTGSAANMVADIAAECTITATIATSEQTAGVLTLFVEYVVHD